MLLCHRFGCGRTKWSEKKIQIHLEKHWIKLLIFSVATPFHVHMKCVSIVIRIWFAQFKFCIQNSYGAFTNKRIESDIRQPERIAENSMKCYSNIIPFPQMESERKLHFIFIFSLCYALHCYLNQTING